MANKRYYTTKSMEYVKIHSNCICWAYDNMLFRLISGVLCVSWTVSNITK